MDYPRKGPVTTLSHTLGFGEVDWVGNYRRGLEVSLENSNAFNNYKLEWEKDITLTATGHLPLSKHFALSGRFMYRQWLDTPYDEAGDLLRGIKNSHITTRYMFSLNMDFPILAKQFYVSKSLYSRTMRFFNFDLHISPFIDLAVVDAPLDEDESFQNFLFTGGMEIILFPHAMRSIYLRVSVGFNMAYYFQTHYIPAGNNRELFIGLGHHY